MSTKFSNDNENLFLKNNVHALPCLGLFRTFLTGKIMVTIYQSDKRKDMNNKTDFKRKRS